MARAKAVCTLMAGSGRSGKSYREVYDLVYEYLPNNDGPVWTNLPLKVDAIAEFVAKRCKKTAEVIKGQLRLIPDDVLASWRLCESGPWEFFRQGEEWEETNSLVNGLLIIDEAHHYWAEGSSVEYEKGWQIWVGELGHANCEIRFLTQDLGKLSPKAQAECGMRYLIVNSETERDPWFKILLNDWYELWAGLTGVWLASCWTREDRKEFNKQVAKDWVKIRFRKDIFALYESHSKPIAGGQSAAGKFEKEYQKRWYPSLLGWFFVRNCDRMVIPGCKAAFVVWLVSGGGGVIMDTVIKTTQNAGKVPAIKKKADAGAATKPLGKFSANLVSGGAKGGETPSLIPDYDLQKKWSEEKIARANTEREKRELEQELIRLRSEVEAGGALAGITPFGIVLKSGDEYTVGVEITEGEYRGRKVAGVHYRTRTAVLDDGRKLRFGWVPVAKDKGDSGDGGGVPRRLRPVAESPEAEQAVERGGRQDNDLGARNAASGADSVVVPQ